MKPSVDTFQSEFELAHLVDVVERHAPKKILEIGVWEGGTLWHWLQIADEVLAVDNLMRRARDWYGWAEAADAELTLEPGLSQAPEVVAEVRHFAPFDFLFIDGDHSYASVRADWDNYSPMVAEGGLVAFHDILPRPGYGVSQLWEELTAVEGARYVTICENAVMAGNEGRCGIGLLYL